YVRDESSFKLLFESINPGIKKNFKESSEFWDAYENPLEPLFKKSLDTFLKANNQTGGIESYSYVVALLVNYEKEKGNLEVYLINEGEEEEEYLEIDPRKPIDSLNIGINFKPKGNYNTLKSNISSKRNQLKNLYTTDQEKALTEASNYFYTTMLNDIVPHWYGTPWDFEGHTNIPNEGEVACGYFVSTTLKHFGFNINRYKLAQQAGMNEALTLDQEDNLLVYKDLSYEELKKRIVTDCTDGLYFVGLSNHVGYLLIKDKELYFLHSSYYDNKVMIEDAVDSPCFLSEIYVIANLTNNKELLRKWILNTEIPVVR
ncbi:MAG: DUF3810 family protein, partial [Flavobacteriaceae bacterium]|nr:DUF3810 family protein [Flavobacteriaceae bacterium]